MEEKCKPRNNSLRGHGVGDIDNTLAGTLSAKTHATRTQLNNQTICTAAPTKTLNLNPILSTWKKEQVEARRCLLSSNEKFCVCLLPSVFELLLLHKVVLLVCGGILTGNHSNPYHPDVFGAKEFFTKDEKGHPI